MTLRMAKAGEPEKLNPTQNLNLTTKRMMVHLKKMMMTPRILISPSRLHQRQKIPKCALLQLQLIESQILRSRKTVQPCIHVKLQKPAVITRKALQLALSRA
jgi:hypothetical protein